MTGAYTIALIIATLVVSLGSLIFGVRRGLPANKIFFIMLIFIFLTFIGSRWMYLATNVSQKSVSFWDLDADGFSLFGGIIFSVLGGSIACYLFRINRWLLADIIAPFLGIGIAIIRVGCFLYGCCFGKETNLPWGVRFPIGSPAHLYQLQHPGGDLLFVHPVHPTQLYELAAGLIGSFLTIIVLRKKLPHGTAFLIFILWFTIFRWINSFFRVTLPSYSAPPYLYPGMYFSIIVIGSLLLWRTLKKRRK